MSRAFGQPVATCCDTKNVAGSRFKIVKYPTRCSRVTKRAQLYPIMLRCVALKSCDRLAGDLRASKFKYEHDLTPVLSTAVSLRVDLDCEEGVLVPRKVSDRE